MLSVYGVMPNIRENDRRKAQKQRGQVHLIPSLGRFRRSPARPDAD